MQSRRSLRLAAGALVLTAPLLTSCGFGKATDMVYTPAEGTNDRSGDIKILSAVVVAAQANSGTFIATFSNNSLDSVSLDSVESAGTPEVTVADIPEGELPPRDYVNLADEGGPVVTGEFEAGRMLPLTLSFSDGQTTTLDVPVVFACDEWADLDESVAVEAETGDDEIDPTTRRQRRPLRHRLRGRDGPRARRAVRLRVGDGRGRGGRMSHTLVLLRHGESVWNAKNLFTGWVDVPLSDKGREEAARGGEQLRDAGLLPDVLHTSLLRRAITTASIALDVADRHWIPVRRDWRLNERHYGDLQGKDKKQTLEQYGEEQFMLWRRSFDTPPPPIERRQRVLPGRRSRSTPTSASDLPRTECLKDVIARLLPYWESAIVPDLAGGQDRAGRRPRQQPARHRQAPRRHQRRGHRRPEHPHRHAAGLRARRRPPAHRPGRALPRPRRRCRCCCRRRQPGPLSRRRSRVPGDPARVAAQPQCRSPDPVPTASGSDRRSGFSPVTTKTTRLATETAWSAIRS